MKCLKCGKDLFNIEVIGNCSPCEDNGWYFEDDNDEGYKYKDKPVDVERDQAEENGECLFGTASGEGCWKITCCNCSTQTHIPRFVG